MDDDRNQLFYEYKKMLLALGVDGFVFENVTGLLNMEGGAVFNLVKQELSACAKNLVAWRVQAENYGIPQRRTRVIILGHSLARAAIQPPCPITSMDTGEPALFGQLPSAISVSEAIGDLPPLKPGEDGSAMDYMFPPKSPYQALMRGQKSPEDYLRSFETVSSELAADVSV